MSRPLGIAAGLLALIVLAAGIWWGSQLYQQHQATLQQLSQAQSSLQDKQNTLSLVEQERKKLSEEYETLKTHWKDAEDHLQQATQESTQAKGELASASQEKANLQRELEEASGKQATFEAQLKQLHNDFDAQKAEHAASEAKLQQTTQRSLSFFETQQVSESFSQQSAEIEHLRQILEECADQYEALLDRSSELEKKLAENPQERQARHERELIQAKTRAIESAHLAVLYQRLGDSYMANTQYAQAAQAFEKSLTYSDDSATHGKLAFIYDRLLADHGKAAFHARLAPGGYDIKEALAVTAKESGMPRNSWKMVWKWLTRPNDS